jgi:hypothetical protein
MIKEFKKLAGDENIVKEFDLSKPESILNETLESVASTIDQKLSSSLPKKYSFFVIDKKSISAPNYYHNYSSFNQ